MTKKRTRGCAFFMRDQWWMVLAAAGLFASWLVPISQPPDANFYHQVVAGVCAGLIVWQGLRENPTALLDHRSLRALAAAVALYVAATLGSLFFGVIRYPGYALAIAISLALAFACVLAGRKIASAPGSGALKLPLAVVVALVTLVSALIAVLQAFGVEQAVAVASPRIGDSRPYGNLMQPNQFAFSLAIGLIAWIYILRDARGLRVAGLAIMALIVLMWGIVLSGSRIGAICVVILSVWIMVDRQFNALARGLMLLALVGFVAIVGITTPAQMLQPAETAQAAEIWQRASMALEGEARIAIWQATLQMIRDHPWLGVGVGGYGFTHTFMSIPNETSATVDHAHNLFLHIVAELGLLAGLVFFAALAAAVWYGRQSLIDRDTRFVWMGLLLVLAYSMVEFPLWYLYFLLPSALALGVLLRKPETDTSGLPSARPPAGAGSWLVLVLAAALCVKVVADFRILAPIFDPESADTPLPDRIRQAQSSFFFRHFADYGAVMVATISRDNARQVTEAIRMVETVVLDDKLVFKYSVSLAMAGDVDRSIYLYRLLQKWRSPRAADYEQLLNSAALPELEAVRSRLAAGAEEKAFKPNDFR